VDENTDVQPLHDICRGVQRGVNIVYNYPDGTQKVDDIPDPLPYDLDAPVVEIEDNSYGLWYAELMQFPDKYNKKTYKFKGFVGKDSSLSSDSFFIGRHVMNCCAADIQFAGMIAYWKKAPILQTGDWIIVEVELKMERNRVYRGKGPVLTVLNAIRCTEPEFKVVTLMGTPADV